MVNRKYDYKCQFHQNNIGQTYLLTTEASYISLGSNRTGWFVSTASKILDRLTS